MPKKIVHTLSVIASGAPAILGPEIMERREVRRGIFRELEADLVFSVETAVALKEWLEAKIDESKRVQEMISSADNADLK